MKAAVRPATEAGIEPAAPAMVAAQFPSAFSRAVLVEVLRRITAGSQASKAGEAARADKLATKGIPALWDQVAWLPYSAPSPRITDERKAACVGLTWFRRGGGMV